MSSTSMRFPSWSTACLMLYPPSRRAISRKIEFRAMCRPVQIVFRSRRS